eukprot:17169-Amphidinium_carterae.1
MSEDGLATARACAEVNFGYVAPKTTSRRPPPGVTTGATKVTGKKGGLVQGGHEALRPSISSKTKGFPHPSTLDLPKQEADLYDLIWRRT